MEGEEDEEEEEEDDTGKLEEDYHFALLKMEGKEIPSKLTAKMDERTRLKLGQ